MLRRESERQQGYLEKVVERKRVILEEELPRVCRSVASMHCLDVVKARLLPTTSADACPGESALCWSCRPAPGLMKRYGRGWS